MSKIMSLIRRAPKRSSAIVAMIAAAVIVPAALLAWGPDRPTFTIKNPAGYVTFNSIIDNPAHGDERNFVQVKEAGASDATYSESVSLTPGKKYTVFMYYHNNAASNLNASGKGIAHGAFVRAELPAVVNKGSTGTKANGYVGATNAKPTLVWDDISFKNATAGDIAIRYNPGSAKIHNFGKSNGATLSDSIITSGAPIGFNSLNGDVPGCNEFSGYVTFNITADQPNFTLEKQVRLAGTTEWKETVEAQPGATVEYQLKYANTGTTEQNNVVLKDTLPTNISYVKGSSYLKNVSNPTPKNVSDNLVSSTGINIGNYAPNSVAYLKFSAKVNADKEKFCEPAVLKNIGRVETNNGSKQDDADVTVKKQDCKPPVKYTCDALKVDMINRTNFRFTTSYTAQNATFKSVTYTVRNANGTVVSTQTSTSNTLNYTQTTAGAYTVQATVTFTVNGSDKTATSEACKGSFKVTDLPKEIQVCELATKTIITIKESDFDSSKHSKNLADCKEEVKKIKVCELSSKQIIVINEKDFDSSKHTTDLSKCKEEEVKKIEVCELTSKTIVTINETDFDATKHTKDLSKCEETPVTPPELPQTGAGENIVAIFGLGALIASGAYYAASRRALNQ
jgi:conserved repeat domain